MIGPDCVLITPTKAVLLKERTSHISPDTFTQFSARCRGRSASLEEVFTEFERAIIPQSAMLIDTARKHGDNGVEEGVETCLTRDPEVRPFMMSNAEAMAMYSELYAISNYGCGPHWDAGHLVYRWKWGELSPTVRIRHQSMHPCDSTGAETNALKVGVHIGQLIFVFRRICTFLTITRN